MQKCILKGSTLKTLILHCIISNETQITLHPFQGRIFAMPEIRADFFLGNIKDWNVFVNFLIFQNFYYFGS